jgi:hypothetical protein
MENINCYDSDNDAVAELTSKYYKESALEEINKRLQNIETAPEVNIEEKQILLEKDKERIFKSNFFCPEKSNHLTGYINKNYIDSSTFNDQYYTYNAYGFAQDPTDFSRKKIVGDLTKYNDPNMSQSALSYSGLSQKRYAKALKKKRGKYGNAGTGSFQGPWASYEGEEELKPLSGELTEEQKKILSQMEEQRLKKSQNENIEDEIVTVDL